MYRLKYDPAAEAAYDALPADAGRQFTLALADVCRDPFGHSIPYDDNDGVVRMVVTDQVFAVVLVGDALRTVTVLQISSFG
ncbi:type II toxin-antitoxin system RelE/ParE family toxin [Streptomyces sp. HPF1205]|uniref:type II toxin-antitoxin system RelE family toxin n=1 Tax=Streptomyces sp. HPF1205 TaxID=2873262 RepID=UPI001CEC40BD|nr:hypothetical protein [Streptomyces sp. HPF1205]